MAAIATCPHCAKQIGLPDSFGSQDRAECPECHAIFLLSEAAQVALPVAIIAPPSEPEPALQEPAQFEEKISASAAPDMCVEANSADSVCPDLGSDEAEPTPQQSWEERLKKALALDCETEADSTEPIPAQATPTIEPAEVASPSFEFQLDPPTAGSPVQESPSLRSAPSIKTLADFAAEAVDAAPEVATPAQPTVPDVLPELDLAKPRSDTFVPPKLQLETPLSTKQKAADPPRKQASPTFTSTAEVVQPTTHARRLARKGFPKLAAFAVGPIAGSLLGLYGLLWVQGDKADYVGLSHVLPASMLPASFGQSDGETELPSTESPIQQLLAKKSSQSQMMKDDSVSLASATRPLQKSRISVSEFTESVDAARAALPSFVQGDLTTPESTRRKGQAYMALCQLSENFDFAKQPGLSPRVRSKVEQATKIFLEATHRDQALRDLAHIAGRWWEYDQRPSDGIFLVGQVDNTQRTADGTLCWVRLSETPDAQAIPVWIEDGRFQTGDRVGVVGRVVSAPQGLPQSFRGTRVVSMSHGFSL